MRKDFHFVLRKRLKTKIIRISKKLKKSYSRTIINIVEDMMPFIERYFLNDVRDERGDYRKFGANAHMHAYLDEKTYNLLKHFTHNLYIHSMAITLRRILEIFVKCVDKYGFVDFKDWLKLIKHKHVLKMAKITLVKKMRHLLYRNGQFDNFINSKIEFNRKFNIIGFDFSP